MNAAHLSVDEFPPFFDFPASENPAPPDNQGDVQSGSPAEAERLVLGALLSDNGWIDCLDNLGVADFSGSREKALFATISAIIAGEVAGVRVADPVSCAAQPELRGRCSADALRAMSTNAACIDPDTFASYVSVIRESSARRQMIEGLQQVNALVASGAPMKKVDRALGALKDEASSRAGGGIQSLGALARNALGSIVQTAETGHGSGGITTGFVELDHLTGGLRGSNLVVVGARPAMGKTAFALALSRASARHGTNVLFLSLEMSGEELAQRTLSMESGVDAARMRDNALDHDDWEALSRAEASLGSLPITIADEACVTVEHVMAVARRAARQGRLDLLVIDYLQLMETESDGRRETRANEISTISRKLKLLAKQLNIPIVILSQLNRELERRPDKRPVMSDLRESGAIEQDADLILFLYRDEVYNPQTLDPGVVEVIIGKQRAGALGTVRLRFDGSTVSFTEDEQHASGLSWDDEELASRAEVFG